MYSVGESHSRNLYSHLWCDLFDDFEQPRCLPMRKEAEMWMAQAEQLTLETAFGQVPLYRQGNVTAPVVLMIHGWGGYGAMFSELAQQLNASGFCVLIPDLPGHGHSECTQSGYAQQLEVLNLIIETFGPVTHLIGHSVGGLLAAMFLEKQQAYTFSTLVLLAAPRSLESLFRAYLLSLGKVSQGYKSLEKVPQEKGAGDSRQLAIRYQMLTGLPEACLTEAIYAQDVDLLICHGLNDQRFEPAESMSIHAVVQAEQLFFSRDTGHLGMLNCPELHLTVSNFLLRYSDTGHAGKSNDMQY
ncbi:alpha/beta fold hydrolase [Vibrio mangrovi]|uniref:Alpha/beta fold hydrolase n=1 Tax=Vibrio mangrovi TaxID=474394 RepID=A0A1Y6IVR3_9VIBR|nr:alpha/beta fold hydrolase [Vibrio mangrovi]MDW6001386.1 alpha/beta fold hydrolase [Vibrio mangrovi]SMS00592.1 Lipase 3 precursor [Vibrio mangrovi]